MKKAKRFLSAIIAVTIAMSFSTQAFAAEENITRAPRGEWRYEYSAPKTTYAEGFAGGQKEEGYGFPSGGFFTYQDSGGPTVEFSVSMGDPYGIFQGTVTLGIAEKDGVIGTGYYVNPDSVNRYKLWVRKKIEVKEYTSYYRLNSNEPWEKVASGLLYKEVALDAWPVVCGRMP